MSPSHLITLTLCSHLLVSILPPPPADRRVIQDSLSGNLLVSTSDVRKAIKSFPCGSAGGPDCLKPQHLKDLISDGTSPDALLTLITGLVNLLLSGRCPDDVHPLLFGGSLTALVKKDGGSSTNRGGQRLS